MEWLKANWKVLVVGLVLGWVLHAFAYPVLVAQAYAADTAGAKALGGDCCSDLEERIAELEVVTVKKDKRKVRLVVYGQISKSLLVLDGDDTFKKVVSNSNEEAESFIGFSASGKIGQGWSAGGVVELGFGGFDNVVFTPLQDDNGVYTRRAFVFVESAALGRASLGLVDQASNGVTTNAVANTGIATTALSLRPLVGPPVGGVADLWDGQIGNGVRYDSPVWAGFVVSASWGNGVDTTSGDLDGNVWDVAVRYSKEYQGFLFTGAAAYRDGIVIPTVTGIEDLKVWTVAGGVKHLTTGIFGFGVYGNLDASGLLPGPALDSVVGYSGQLGVEQRWFGKIGKSTVFVEYTSYDFDELGGDATPTALGLGFVQAVDAAGMDLYVAGKQYDLDTAGADDVTVVQAGARVKF